VRPRRICWARDVSDRNATGLGEARSGEAGADPLAEEGRPIEVEGRDLLARIFQHEMDHLNGLFFVDRLSPAKRDILIRKLKKVFLEPKD